MTIVGASWPRSAHWGRYLLPVAVWVSAGPVQLDRPKHATVCASQRRGCTCPRHGNLSHWPCLLLLISLVNHPDQHDAHARVWQTRWNVGRPRRPRWPLFPAVTTGDGGSRARCRTPFARCKRAHMWAEVISASATRVCWISAGVGAESGSPPGLMVPVFWHRAQLSPASNARLKCAAHYADLPGMDK